MSQIHILLHFQQQGDAPIPSLGTGKLRKGSLTALSGGPQGGDTPRGQRLAAGGALRAEQHHPQEGRGAGAQSPRTWGLCSRLALGLGGRQPGADSFSLIHFVIWNISVSFQGLGVLLFCEACQGPTALMITTEYISSLY